MFTKLTLRENPEGAGEPVIGSFESGDEVSTRVSDPPNPSSNFLL